MASIIAGRGNGFDDGIIGVAPEAKILSIRVIPDMNDPGYKKYDDEREGQIQDELAEGISQAVRDHAQVISMSIGYSAPSGRGPGRAAVRLRPRHRPGGVGRQLGRQRRAAHPQRRSWLCAGVVPGRVPGGAERGRGQHGQAADVVLQRQPLGQGRGAGGGGPRPGQERPVLHRQRHQPGLRAGGGGGRADQVEVPVDHARPGDGGADDHRPAADAGRQLQRAHRLRHRERGRGADRGGQAGRRSARPAPRSRCRPTSAGARRRSRPRR